ncbi:IclR family transcriptional regulator [Microbacterium gorillae]|uniref:IclR family transcriptional regulator n=1 Tax=Microbacterium gorillae TaxID=1231063 RepID=UPI000AFBCD8E|nr:helix-turn-helix domain-containing protein [Microbacterium gorillae]
MAEDSGSAETTKRGSGAPQHHRTIDRVTQILEEVVYSPGLQFAELARRMDVPKSSVHGFIRGLVASGWLHEDNRRFYIGPAVYGLTIADGSMRPGHVSQHDLDELQKETGGAVFLGMQAGDSLIYVAQAGSDSLDGFRLKNTIRRTVLDTAGGKALLAAMPETQRQAFLRRHVHESEELVDAFLQEYDDIRATGLAYNKRTRYAVGAALTDRAGDVVGSITITGKIADAEPRREEIGAILLKHIERWRKKA